MPKPLVLDEYKRFSQSRLWSLQREYYENSGIAAWTGEVPYYVTSNPFIANTYANLVIAFVCDWVAQHPDSKNHPFYIVELGTGPGQFSFYVLKRLAELQQELAITDISIRYIMSDFSEKNIEFWRTHHALKPFVENGTLEFAVFNLEQENSFDIPCENPLVVFSNYMFDTITNDVFTVTNSELQESLVEITTPGTNVEKGIIRDIEKIQTHFKSQSFAKPYYDNPKFNQILERYQHDLIDTHFLFPIGALKALEQLQHISGGKLLLISSDKGYSTLDELDNLDYPQLAFHGSFSVMVNYHAIAEYFKLCQGDALLQTPREGITTAVFASGFTFQGLLQTSQALSQHVEGFSPADYFVLHEHMSKSYKKCDAEVLTAHLNLSRWDPHIFSEMNERICHGSADIDYDTQQYLAKHMENIAQNFYFIPDTYDTFFDIGVFFHGLERFDQALPYYEKSLEFFGDNYVLSYNIALSYHYLGEHEKAITYFQKALKQNPRSKEVKEWLTKLSEN